jgi:hypothetical protein
MAMNADGKVCVFHTRAVYLPSFTKITRHKTHSDFLKAPSIPGERRGTLGYRRG